jgi:ankyrin repeat protein
MINLLLKAGAEINLCDESGWSALVYAAEQGRWAAVELLVANGAQTDVKPDGVPLDVFIQERAASRITERGRKILCATMNR